MAYIAPYIDESGLTIPSYQDILDDLIAQAKTIYGQDIYLGEDTTDYQFISIFALKTYDCLLALQLTYTNRSPQTSIGAALDSLVKLNGISRKEATYSTCVVTLTGVVGTVINSGMVGDINGKKWDLPVVVTIGSGGTVDVVVTCQELGVITALAGNLSIILTPTSGWTSVTNAGAAAVGQAIETDAALKVRQAASTSLPSQTLVAGTYSAIAIIDGVLRHKVYENPTAAADSEGIPRNSIAAVVEGGIDADIANAIYINKTPGCGMDGEVTVVVTDIINAQTMNVKFHRPTAIPIFVTVNIKSLAGYNVNTIVLVKFWIAAMINSRNIGDDIENSFLYWAAMTYPEGNPLLPAFSISSLVAGVSVGAQSAATIVIVYDAVAMGDVNNIVITVV